MTAIKTHWDGHGVRAFKDDTEIKYTTAVIFGVCCTYGAEPAMVAQIILNREHMVGERIRTLYHFLTRGHRVGIADDALSGIWIDDQRWDWNVLDHPSNYRM